MRAQSDRQGDQPKRLDRASDSSEWVPVKPARPEPPPFSLEWAALKFFSSWTPDDLRLAIERGLQVDLSPFSWIVEELAVQKVLEFFASYRPDLFAVLSTEDGMRWLRSNVRRVLGGVRA